MIGKALDFLSNEVNDYITNIKGEANRIEISPLADENGKVPFDNLGITLINIEEEKVLKAGGAIKEIVNGQVFKSNREVNVNLYMLVSANFNGQYDEALKFLSYVVTFFQYRNVFTLSNSPNLDPEIKKLIVDLYSPTFEQQNNLWGALGAKYLPSVVYKVRMLVLQEQLPEPVSAPIKQIDDTPNHKHVI